MSSGAQEIPPAPRPVFALRAEKGAEPRSGPTEPVARPAPSHVGPGTRGAPAAGGAAVRSPSARAGGGSCSLRSPPPPFLRPPPAGGGAERSGGVLSGSAMWGGGRDGQLTPRSNSASGSAPSPLGVNPPIPPRSGHWERGRPRGALLAGGAAREGGRRAAAAPFLSFSAARRCGRMLLPGGLCAGWAGLAGAPGCFRNANGGGGGGGGLWLDPVQRCLRVLNIRSFTQTLSCLRWYAVMLSILTRQPGTSIVPCTASSWLARQAHTEPFARIRCVRLCDLLAGSYSSVPVPICAPFDFIVYSTFIWQCFPTLSRSFEF